MDPNNHDLSSSLYFNGPSKVLIWHCLALVPIGEKEKKRKFAIKVNGSSVACFLNLDLYIWLFSGLVRIRGHTSYKYVFKRDWTMFSIINIYVTLNNEHNWEDLCIQLRSQQKCIYDKKKVKLREIRFSIQFLLQILHQRFANATRVLLWFKSKW